MAVMISHCIICGLAADLIQLSVISLSDVTLQHEAPVSCEDAELMELMMGMLMLVWVPL